MKDSSESGKAEIVIVRRRGGEDAGGGKAGAWKIAYADFVTAMMAFFLVMWLINASNEKTRAQVASYFNPIKLTDTSTGARSLKDFKDVRDSEKKQERGSGEGSTPKREDMETEAELMANPPDSLDRMARTISEADFRNAGLESDVEIAPALKPETSNPGVGDPFDPRAWEKVKASPPVESKDGAESPTPDQSRSTQMDQETTKQAAAGTQQTAAADHAAEPPGEVAAKNEDGKDLEKAKAEQEAADISREIASRLGGGSEDLEKAVSVVPSAGGILISLTEGESFEMFATGSAEPKPQTLKLVEAIASVVKTRDGELIIRGHTDSRPYRNKYYDNWQLSTARAHFARYMLIRGGLDEKRIRRIEGVADREPRNTADPQAAENRRIEILISSEDP